MFGGETEPGILRLCLVGVSGLVGQSLIEEARSRPQFRLTGLVRSEAPLPPGARIELVMADPAGWPRALADLAPTTVICTLGTTRAKAGSEAAFRAVDVDLVLAVAQAAKAAGAEHFILVSSVGADPTAGNAYLRAKGDAEAAVARLGFRRLDMARPAMLIGPRRESRPLEWIAQKALPLFDGLLLGKARRFRTIRASVLARALLGLATERAGGRFVHEHDGLLRAARRLGG